MKIQNFAVVFIVIIMPIALLLSVYTGNLIDVANKQTMYDSILLNSTYDAIRAYQMNTLNDNYEAENNSKIRDINASVNTFFNSLAAGFSTSALTKRELTDYIPAMLYTLYDGYYVYGTYGNAVSTAGGINYRTEGNISNKEYGLKPYVYYSCEYADKAGTYDIIVNYTLDNYITVTGTYTEENGNKAYISKSGYYINTSSSKIIVNTSGAEPANYDNKIVTLYPGSDKEVVIRPETLGEYITAIDSYTVKEGDTYNRNNNKVVPENGNAKYYNYVIYNDVKYYIDDDLITNGAVNSGILIREGSENLSFNSTFDGIPIFYLQNGKRTYISRSALNEIKSYLGVENDREIYDKSKYKDVNAYYYYYKSYNFSKDVYNALKNIDLGHTTITDEESGKTINVITSNLQYGEGGNLAYYNDNGKVTYIGDAGNVIKTDTYHTRYTNEAGIETHVKSMYETSKVFNFDEANNDPELESSSFNRHRIDVIISSIESSLVTAIGNFRAYTGGNYEYKMPTLKESEWDEICNNITIVTFMQGLTIGNYKYYSNYSVVENNKVKDYIPKKSIYVQESTPNETNEKEYHNPRCIEYNEEITTNAKAIVGYRNIDYEREKCSDYYYYLHQGGGAYECVVGQNSNVYTTDELLSGTLTAEHKDNIANVNGEIRRAYITALAREKGNSYKTYGFLNTELEEKSALGQGVALYTVHFFYQEYKDGVATNNYNETEQTYTSTARAGTKISDLGINDTPRKGYKRRAQRFMLATHNYSGGDWEEVTGSTTLTGDNTTDIALYFDVDLNQQKTLYYDLEQYVWDEDTGKYELEKTQRIEEKKWVNDSDDIEVKIEKEYEDKELVYTDPAGYEEEGKTIVTGSEINAYYSNSPEYSEKTYIVRYNANGGTGVMDNSTFKFFEKSQLSNNRFVKQGESFAGWALSEEGEVVYGEAQIIAIGDGDNIKEENGQYYLDLYAQWIGIKYEVAYIPNGATSGQMDNTQHEYGVKANLRKNAYKKEHTITLDLGVGKTNYYSNGTFSNWGSGAQITYNANNNEFTMNIAKGSAQYSGLYYTGTNAILKIGRTATISYEVYSDKAVTLIMKYQNQIQGQSTNSNSGANNRQDGNNNAGIEERTIPAKTWTKVYFTYTNKSNNAIYDYSILSANNTEDVSLRIRNPRFEIVNADGNVEGNQEKYRVESTFKNWTNEGQTYQDEAEVMNLTEENGKVVNMTAQWENYKFNLPEIYAEGYEFQGWYDEEDNKLDPNEPVIPDEDVIITAKWKDTTPPAAIIEVIDSTTSTLTTRTTVTDKGSGMVSNIKYIYYIRKANTNDAFEEIDGGNQAVFTFTNRDQETLYEIRVRVYEDYEENSAEASTTGKTKKLRGTIYVQSHNWVQNTQREGTETVIFGAQIETDLQTSGIYIEHSLNPNGPYVAGDKQEGVAHGQYAYARLTDGHNHLLDSTSYRAWDSGYPTISIMDDTASQDESNKIKVTVLGAMDIESGLGANPTYTYSCRKSPSGAWTTVQTTAANYTFTGLTQNTLYDVKVSVKDRGQPLTQEASFQKLTTYTYNINYNGNGQTSGSMGAQVCQKDYPVKLNNNAFSRTGYTYQGWSTTQYDATNLKITDNMANNVRYSNQQWVLNLSTNGSNVTLYAVWLDNIKPVIGTVTAGYFDVTLNATDSGTGVASYFINTTGTAPSLTTGGWVNVTVTNNLQNYKITGLSHNTTYYLWVKDKAGNISDRKQIKTNLKTYTVTFNANGGSGGPAQQTKTHGVNLSLTLTPQPTRKNWLFQGWASTSSATSPEFTTSKTYTTDADVTYYAVWMQYILVDLKTTSTSINLRSYRGLESIGTIPISDILLVPKVGNAGTAQIETLKFSNSGNRAVGKGRLNIDVTRSSNSSGVIGYSCKFQGALKLQMITYDDPKNYTAWKMDNNNPYKYTKVFGANRVENIACNVYIILKNYGQYNSVENKRVLMTPSGHQLNIAADAEEDTEAEIKNTDIKTATSAELSQYGLTYRNLSVNNFICSIDTYSYHVEWANSANTENYGEQWVDTNGGVQGEYITRAAIPYGFGSARAKSNTMTGQVQVKVNYISNGSDYENPKQITNTYNSSTGMLKAGNAFRTMIHFNLGTKYNGGNLPDPDQKYYQCDASVITSGKYYIVTDWTG